MVESSLSLREVTGGVDTHADTHTVAALDELGRLLGHQQFPATTVGYGQLEAWLRSLGRVVAIGMEGTGSYGAGLFQRLWSTACGSSRSTSPTGVPDERPASPTPPTRSQQHGPSRPAEQPEPRRPATASWSPSGH